MPLVCSICVHADRDDIDELLLRRATSLRVMAQRFGTSTSALHRHRTEHLATVLTQAETAREQAHADDLLEQLRWVQRRTVRLLDTAEANGKLGVAVFCIREARGNIELLAKLLAVAAQAEQAAPPVTASPEWAALRRQVLTALGDYPEARLAVVDAITSVEAGG